MSKKVMMEEISMVNVIESEAMVTVKAEYFNMLLAMAKDYEIEMNNAKKAVFYEVSESTVYKSGHYMSLRIPELMGFDMVRAGELVRQLIEDDAAMEIVVVDGYKYYEVGRNSLETYNWDDNPGRINLLKEFPEFQKAWDEAADRIAQCTKEEREEANNAE